MSDYEVWGFTIQTTAAGKKIWPKELKWEATRRIREEGQSPGDIAAELDAHECLVRKWSVADRRRRGEKIKVEGPAFAPLSFDGESPVARAYETPTEPQSGYGRISCGSAALEFPLGISETDLIKLIRVAERVG